VYKILLFTFLLTGCGFYPNHTGYIDPEFVPYVNDYKQDKFRFLNTNKIKKISITFKVLDSDLDGECEIHVHSNRLTGKVLATYRMVYINTNHWPKFNYISKKLLIYHELGHCDLGLDHTYENTIMNPYAIDYNTFLISPDYYLNLLFNEGK